MFRNRLRKNARHLRKWAAREQVTCYRLYDRDIPEVPVVVDWYEGRVHVAEFERNAPEGTSEDPVWFETMAATAAEVMDVPLDRTFLKVRRRQAGTSQYQRFGTVGARFIVSEGGLRFVVNLSDYLDTGLFLDHRMTRARVRDEARGARMLNLFAYTGSFSVYAAAGGAESTTTVDMSNTYLEWAEENLALNGFQPPAHRIERHDALGFLEDGPRDSGRFDLIVLDPPTFSNSKKMAGTFDVQRDHLTLVEQALRFLAPGGVLWFSTNMRRFHPDLDVLSRGAAVEMTAKTVPPDFAQHRPHRVWRIG
jgi:23S rRNA (cytosine1962-C5)-methyltransferase